MSISQNSQNLELDKKRHSFAHLMAAAVQEMFPEAQFGVGPVIENGCFYDFILPRTLIPEDLPLIEDKISKFLKEQLIIEKQEMSFEEAISFFEKSNQLLKVELLNDLASKGTTNMDEAELALFDQTQPIITMYSIINKKTGDVIFQDLCKGPHIEEIKELRSVGFKLDKFSSAYWRGDQDRNISMQRIYALVFETKDELKAFIAQREEAKKRDHRVLGEQLSLFMFSDIVGKGLPLWLEKGATIKRVLERFIVEEEIRRGYRHVNTPDMANLALYEKSGHYPYYKESMYVPIEIDKEQYMLRPMTCPHHFQIYLQKPRSYRELPMRIAELAKLYRYEDSGALTGLTRVRCFCLADSHIVCMPEQAKEESARALDLIEYCASVFGLEKNKDYRYELSLGDRGEDKKFFKDDKAWDFAEGVLREVLEERGEQFNEEVGEAAFYGPKIDIQMRSITGKESTAFTVQYDFVMPKRFELKYMDSEQNEQETVVIHRSSIGAIERIFAFLTEFYGGRFPFWLAPEQIRILTINDQVLPYVEKVKEILSETVLMKPLKYNEIRYEIDSRSESLGKKIRESELDKIPMTFIIGQKDVENNEVSIRTKTSEDKVKLNELKAYLENWK
jgi:threonyl-tRNA synthetase